MAKRHGMSRSHSKRLFTSAAQRVHPKNFLGTVGGPGPMRGGIRL